LSPALLAASAPSLPHAKTLSREVFGPANFWVGELSELNESTRAPIAPREDAKPRSFWVGELNELNESIRAHFFEARMRIPNF
jgi:hypothetical protein